MSKLFHCTFEVRGYELDGFQHVNHAQYVHYFEHARWQWLKSAGITLKSMDAEKKWPVIARIEIDYKRPLYIDDVITIECSAMEVNRTHFLVKQRLFRGDVVKHPDIKHELCAEAVVKVVIVGENKRPTEASADWLKLQ